MEWKVKKFLIVSLIAEFVISICIFYGVTVYLGNKTEESVSEVTEIYMSEINQQLQQKFTSIVELRLEQMGVIIGLVPPEENKDTETVMRRLEQSASIRGFASMGFYTGKQQIETFYGDPIRITGVDNVYESLEEGGNIIAEGQTDAGEKILIFGRPAAYQLQNGEKSVALVASISMDMLEESMYLDEGNSLAFSHIIDQDGNFIIRNKDAAHNTSFFERIEHDYEPVDGKEPEDYIRELHEAIETGADYCTLIQVNGERRHIFCAPIAQNSDWYLISVMPNGVLEDAVTGLETVRILAMFFCSFTILLTMLIVFLLYLRKSQKQVHELNQARAEAIHANQAKSEFLSSMSHDIRTPMNAIVGMTEIALKNLDDKERTEDCLKKVRLSSKHLLGLINDVLDMSKIESGKMTLNIAPMSLRETMDDIVNIMQPQVKDRNQFFDIFIEKIIAENVNCDSVRLNQILLNILSNSVKFTPEKGKISVHLYQEESPRGDDLVRTHFRITDTGIGMSKEFQQHIWDTFAREDTEQVQNITGTGLGMAITKCIVDLLDGIITVESEPGKGTEFHVILDLEKADGTEEEMHLPDWNILVVDDNDQLCRSAVSNLEELGTHAEWILDGREAVKLIEKRHQEHNDYHFVLIDWKMPHMDGLQTIREVRRTVGTEVPIFLISAYDWSDIEEEAIAANVEGFIPKPLFKSTLYACLSQYMGEGTRVEKQVSEAEEAVDFTGRRILLAEDIEINWEIANEILSSVGLVLEWAQNGKICVEMFEQSEPGYYDAVLMDIRMPVMSGYDAAREIRKLDRPDRDLPIIAMTADAFSGDVQRCLDAGMNAHVAKPIDVKELMQVLQKYLNEKI